MEYDDQEGDWEKPRDDEERRLGKFMRELAAVDHSEDRKIFWGLPFLFLVILVFYLTEGLVHPLIIAVVIVGGVFGGIGWVIYSNIRRKREVMIRHGLKCGECGYLPSAFLAGGVYAVGRCPKCRNALDLR